MLASCQLVITNFLINDTLRSKYGLDFLLMIWIQLLAKSFFRLTLLRAYKVRIRVQKNTMKNIYPVVDQNRPIRKLLLRRGLQVFQLFKSLVCKGSSLFEMFLKFEKKSAYCLEHEESPSIHSKGLRAYLPKKFCHL